MAKSDADVCNLALLRAGQTQFIDDLEEASPEAQVCSRVYQNTRDTLLTRYDWPFATRSAFLALIDGVTRPGWSYAYGLPKGCLKPRYIFSGARPTAPAAAWPSSTDVLFGVTTVSMLPALNGVVPEVPFVIEANDAGTGQILLTDLDQAQLVYTVALEVAAAFPQPFVEALAWAMAPDVCLGLTKNARQAMALGQQAEIQIQRAWTQALNAQGQDIRADSEFVAVRG